MKPLDALEEQATAFRAAAVRLGGAAAVPTCPGWDVRKLVRHLARVYVMATEALRLDPSGPAPRPERAPEEFDAALSAWDDRYAELRTALSEMDEQRPVWAFFAPEEGALVSAWTRRMLHETAIHRLDAQYAEGGLEELLFDPELAADGVDEMLTQLLPLQDWSAANHRGRVLYHAADAGRMWLVTYQAGVAPSVDTTPHSALEQSDVDSSVAGTADAVYRRVWGRPSTAVISGETTLAGLAAGR